MTKKNKQIFSNVASTLRTVGLKATVTGDVITVAPFGRTRTFDIATPEGRQHWRKFYFAMKGRASRKRAKITPKRRPMSELQLLRFIGLI